VVVWTEGRAAVERCRPGVARGGGRRDRLVPAGEFNPSAGGTDSVARVGPTSGEPRSAKDTPN